MKSCFTFTQRKVEKSTVHLYQMGAVKMFLYYVEKRLLHKIKEKTNLSGRRPVSKQQENLRPHQCYVIPKGTVYVTYATNKSSFPLSFLRSDAADLSFEFINRIRETPRKPPVRIPLIEEAVIGDEEKGREVNEMLSPASAFASLSDSAASNPFSEDLVLLNWFLGLKRPKVCSCRRCSTPPPPIKAALLLQNNHRLFIS